MKAPELIQQLLEPTSNQHQVALSRRQILEAQLLLETPPIPQLLPVPEVHTVTVGEYCVLAMELVPEKHNIVIVSGESPFAAGEGMYIPEILFPSKYSEDYPQQGAMLVENLLRYTVEKQWPEVRVEKGIPIPLISVILGIILSTHLVREMDDMEKRDIIQGFEAARAKTFVFMAQAIIEELGEEEGKKKVLETVWKMSKSSGEAARDSYLERCVEPSWRNHRESNGPVYALAWDGGVISDDPDWKVVEYTYCPLGDAFLKLGKNGEMLGDLYCSVTDNAFWSGFNPDWVVVREKSFSKDGVCRLIWKRSKQ